MKALVFGQSEEIISSTSSMLHRAGFEVDTIFYNLSLKNSKFISGYEMISYLKDMPPKISERNLDNYDFVIPTDDDVLKSVLNSDISTKAKLRLLQIKNEKDLVHVTSKIGLSKTLSQAQVLTPDFAVVNDINQAKKAAKTIGYPILVKIDYSSAGRGVLECNNEFDIDLIDKKIFETPVLIQKKINGTEFDLSAIYHDEELIYFNFAKIEKTLEKFGPSILRTYYQLANIDKNIFEEMKKLGKAIGANGFVTISAIESADDKKIYFVEADMKPNVWTDFGKFIGNDPAPMLNKWFLNKEKILDKIEINSNYPMQILAPFFMRMSPIEILFNRYKVWKFLPREDMISLTILLKRKFTIDRLEREILRKVKYFWTHLNNVRRFIKYLPVNLVTALMQREMRLLFRSVIKRPY